ncbi:unnamed protein product [Clonostachys rosea]|uniref:Uncharacterized protein n=1 Tax=Bionectria ochroleuca TaxID=29856 RepID=A0ABY6TVB6_BIOOC|nr:unnamed protein product [Clonostachys rosea]
MPAKPEEICTAKDTNPEGLNVRFWGTQSPCTKVHAAPDISHSIMDLVYWMRLGRDTEARSCREWLDPGDSEEPAHANWFNFLCSIGGPQTFGGHQDEMERGKYAIKFPGILKPIPVDSQGQLDNMLRCVSKYLRSTPTYWCQAPPPVLLGCTPDQVARCESRDWVDCVWREAAIFHKAAAEAAREDNTTRLDDTLQFFEDSDSARSPRPGVLYGEIDWFAGEGVSRTFQ